MATIHRLAPTEMRYVMAETKIKAAEVTKSVDNKSNYYVPEIALPMKTIKVDLTKTVAVTILALLLQVVLFMYLQKGGWTIVVAKLQQISL